MNRKFLILLSIILGFLSIVNIPVHALSSEDDKTVLNHFVWKHESAGEKSSINLGFVIKKQFSSDEPDKKEYFEFLIKRQEDGNPMPGQLNVSEYKIGIYGAGTVKTPEITFSQEGKYVYSVSEISGSLNGYEYDDSVYTITVEIRSIRNVMQVHNIVLSKEKNNKRYDADEIAFVNTYKDNTHPPDIPKMTDESNQNFYVGMLIFSLVGIIVCAVFIFSMRKRPRYGQK